MKKSLAGLSTQQGSLVPSTCVHVSKAPDVRGIMGLQDVQPGTTDNACKTCGQTAIVQLQYSASSTNHSPDTATVQGDPTARRRAVDQTYSRL
jgi:hypothetical protein